MEGSKCYLKPYTDENELPQNKIQNFIFGNNGFVWIATQGRFVRFCGGQMVTNPKKQFGVESDWYIGVGLTKK